MATTIHRPQSFSSPKKAKSKVAANEKDMWSTLLDSVTSGKRLPEKKLIILGGSPATQESFIATLDPNSPKNLTDRQRRRPSVANDFALGYTYQDILDADHEDSLARLSIYTLQESSTAFSPLLKPLLTPAAIPETLLIILLDWSRPWQWAREIQEWIRLLSGTLSSLDDDSKATMQEIMHEWEQRRRGGSHDMGGANAINDPNVAVPLGPGEWDEPLGLPLCVACHNADQIDVLEREHGWKEEEFDYVLQFLRTVLLKHGASLIYTSGSVPNSLPLLVQYSLGIHSILKRQPLKHNVVDRDKTLIPPNWDSWGKIRILREGFDVEGISEGWSTDIHQPNTPVPRLKAVDEEKDTELGDSSALAAYESVIQDPISTKPRLDISSQMNGVEVGTPKMQDFLADQLAVIERIKAEEEHGTKDGGRGGIRAASGTSVESSSTIEDTSRVKEHVGPIQFNMGGIQVDAEDMLNRIKERSNEEDEPQSPQTEKDLPLSPAVETGAKPNQDHLAKFFKGLVKKGGGGSAPGTPPMKGKTPPIE